MTIPKIISQRKTNDWFFKEQLRENGHDPYYGHVICHALLNLMQKNKDLSREDILKILESAKNALKNFQYFKEDYFIEIYPMQPLGNKQCFCINDKSDAMYPLLLDSSRDRDDAFIGILKEVIENFENVFNILQEQAMQSGWTEIVQQELEQHVKPVETRIN